MATGTATVFDDGRWLEGPAYSPLWRSVLFSDIPNDRVLRWDETTGAVGVWRSPAGYANGRIVDRQGRVVHCHHGSRSVTRVEPDGSVTTLADAYEGRRLNSPNDLVERADGSIWFTDPSYGIHSDYEGHQGESETDGCHVYRVDADGSVTGWPTTSRSRTGWRSRRTSGSSTSSTPSGTTSAASTWPATGPLTAARCWSRPIPGATTE